uniref:MFS transporter n=1 Tax=Panagrolaimus superbus TaxID=310955 RepID=A0A914YC87_9BILA
MDSRALGLAMGLYIGGNAIGGMSGRLLAGIIADHWGWRWGIGYRAVVAAAATVAAFPFTSRRPAPIAVALAHAVRRPGPAVAVRYLVRADGRVRHPLQLPGLPPAGAAVPSQPDRGRPDLQRLSGGHLQLGVDGPAGHALRPRPHPVDLVCVDRRRHRAIGTAVVEHDGAGYRTGDLWLLRWPLGGQQLGRQPCRCDARRSLGAVPVRLLPGFERARWCGRPGLCGVGLAGCVPVRRRADPDRRWHYADLGRRCGRGPTKVGHYRVGCTSPFGERFTQQPGEIADQRRHTLAVPRQLHFRMRTSIGQRDEARALHADVIAGRRQDRRTQAGGGQTDQGRGLTGLLHDARGEPGGRAQRDHVVMDARTGAAAERHERFLREVAQRQRALRREPAQGRVVGMHDQRQWIDEQAVRHQLWWQRALADDAHVQ